MSTRRSKEIGNLEHVYVFKEQDFDNMEPLPVPIGRLQLKSGNVIRMVFTPKGFVIAIPSKSLTNGDIITVEAHEGEFGLCLRKELEKNEL